MALFDLPPELFARTISFLVGDVGPLFVTDYRLVCKSFAFEIQKDILTRQPLIVYSEDERKLPAPKERHMAIAVDHARFEKLFALHGGIIIGHEVLRRSKDPLPIIQYLRKLIDAVFALGFDPASDECRKQYAIDICTALSSIYWKQLRWRLFLHDDSEVQAPSIKDDLPAAIAAIGKTEYLLSMSFSKGSGLVKTCSCLPSPLQSAAACGKTNVVQAILNRVAECDSKDGLEWKIGYWPALIAAMRKAQLTSGLVLVNLYLENSSKYKISGDRMLKDSLRQADAGFPRAILEHSNYIAKGLILHGKRFVLEEGTCSVLRMLLEQGHMDPNHLDDTTPLTLAVHNHRYDLARVLLQHGADIDGVPETGELVTALWRAAKTGYRGYGNNRLPGIRFLLQHGADPDMHGDWRSPLRAAEGLWSDVHFLLQKAKDHGKDIALHPDTWKEYEEMRSDGAYVDADKLPDAVMPPENERGLRPSR